MNPSHFPTMQPLLLFGGLLTAAAAGGCWEEIRHETELPSNAPSPPAATPQPAPASTLERVEQPTSLQDEGVSQGELPADPTGPTVATEIADPAGAGDATASAIPAAGSDSPPIVEQRAAWEAASQWSLAGALLAKHAGTQVVQEKVAAATVAADKLGVSLPAWSDTDAGMTPADAARALCCEAGPALWRAIVDEAGPKSGAAAELACRTHRLLLVYSPRENDAEETAALQQAARSAALPEPLWRPLIELLERQADYDSVKQAVFALHRATAEYLAGG